MKKGLLFAAALLCAGSVFAKDYTLFSSENYASLEWTGGNDGYTTEVTVDGVKFTLTTAKSKDSSNMVKPGDQIRVYKNASFTITADGLNMKSVELTAGGSSYAGVQSYSEGWTATADGLVVTAVNADGAADFVMTSTANQFRIVNLVVRDEAAVVEPPVEIYTSVANVEATKALATDTKVKVDYPLTIAFKSNSNLFCCDAEGNFIQVYGENSYEANDVIPAGWEATYKLYGNTTPELVPDATLPEATEKATFVPKTVAPADVNVDLVNSVVTIPDVEFAEATPSTKTNFGGISDGVELSFRNNYTIEGVDAGKYDVTVVVTVYQNAPSLYVISYAAASSAVEGVEVAEGAAEYYNLQGVKVVNPEKGIYVRVQNGKAAKVVL